MDKKLKAIDVFCPMCSAMPGEPCRSYFRPDMQTKDPHERRRLAALEAEEKSSAPASGSSEKSSVKPG